jgi:hypothetical protein
MATKSTNTDTGWMMYVGEPVIFIHGARAPTYRKWIDRDRKTGQLVEKELRPPLNGAPCPPSHEPMDPGSEGVSYVFKQGDKIPDSHVAVAERPQWFVPCAAP